MSPQHQPHGHIACQGETQQFRVVQAGIEGQPLGFEIDHPQEIDIQLQELELLVRQQRPDDAQDDHPHRVGDLDQQPQLDGQQRGGAPADARHRPKDEAARLDRENLAQVAEDPAGIGDHILGEEHAAQGSVTHPRAQPFDIRACG